MLAQALPAPKSEGQDPYGVPAFQALIIEWGEPYRETGSSTSMPVLKIPFKVLEAKTEGKHEITKQLQVEVVVVREPDKQLDFSQPCKKSDVIRREMRLNGRNFLPAKSATGYWLAELDISGLNFPIGKSARFQAFIQLPKLFWTTDEPELFSVVHKNSITTVQVQGPLPLSEMQLAINHCPTQFDAEFNPSDVLKAVNPLIRLGKEKALQELKSYDLIAGHELSRTYWRPESKDTTTHWCIPIIAETMFENYPSIEHKYHQYRDMAVQDGIPFHLIRQTAFFGVTTRDHSGLFKGLQREGKMLPNELVPSGNPLRAADSLFDKILDVEKKSSKKRLKWKLRIQAWLMVRQYFPKVADNAWTDELWNELVKQVDAKGLKWNLQRNEYEAAGK